MHSWVGVSRNWKQNFRTKSWWVPWTQKWHFHVWVWLSACLLGCGFMEWLSYHQKQADLGVLPVSRFPMCSPLFGSVSPSKFHDVLCAVTAHCSLAGVRKWCFYVHNPCPCRRASGEMWCPVPDRCVLRTDSFDSPHVKDSHRHQNRW